MALQAINQVQPNHLTEEMEASDGESTYSGIQNIVLGDEPIPDVFDASLLKSCSLV